MCPFSQKAATPRHGCKLLTLTSNAQRFFLPALIALAALMAWQNYFMQDDAYIAFRYAKNLAEGNGLVWYPQLREYGYTNFLFTLSVGGLMWLGFDPEIAASLITVPAFIGSVILTVMLGRSISRHPWVPYIAGLAVATHHTISAYASGGMETSLQMFLVLLTYCLILWYCNGARRISPWAIALSSSLALLCRLDSALLLFYAYLYLAAHFLKKLKENGTRRLWLPALVTVLVPTLAVFGLLLGCYLYYGTPLPNTFYAKIDGSGEFLPEGFQYLYSYLTAQSFFPLCLIFLAAAAWIAARSQSANFDSMVFYALAACLVWILYIVYIGGDFMEFRMLVPALPLFYIGCLSLIAWAVPKQQPWFWLLLTVVCVAVNIQHAIVFQSTRLTDTTAKLNRFLTEPYTNWIASGKSLGKLFYTGSPDDVLIATYPAGAIPYYSGLPTVDLFGLNDRWVAENGWLSRRMAGHRHRAPDSYLEQKKVNIIIDFPRYYCPKINKEMRQEYTWLPALLLPLENDCYLIGHYLTPHPKIDELIKAGTIQMMPVVSPAEEKSPPYIPVPK